MPVQKFLNRDELAQAIKQSSVFARQSANVVKLSLKASSIELSANVLKLVKTKFRLMLR